MPSHPEGLKIALERIAAEKERRTGFLDLGLLGMEELPEALFELEHLEGLNLGRWWRDANGHIQFMYSRLPSNRILAELSKLSRLPRLQSLSISATPVSDLAPIGTLGSLTHLDCSGTQVSDLNPITTLESLTYLNCSHTQVSDLNPITTLGALTHLDFSGTQVRDLNPITTLGSLTHLYCFGTQVSDLNPITTLGALIHLYCFGTQVSDLNPITTLGALTYLNCSGTQVSDLNPITTLGALTYLNCSGTQVSDLNPITTLGALTHLDCSDTQVSDLNPITTLGSLTHLDCSGTQVRDLNPITTLGSLTHLDCSGTQVSDLNPITTLGSLTELNCSRTQVSDLNPITTLGSLTELNCSRTQVSDLNPITTLESLTYLNCSHTQVSDLNPITTLESLTYLNCSHTQVSDLNPITTLGSLTYLNCSENNLAGLPESLIRMPSLKTLALHRTLIPGIPIDILSQRYVETCLDRLRAHFDDLKAGAAVLPDVKVLILGNGRIGKTQICRRLRGKPFEESADSTHGIVVTSTDLTDPDGSDQIRMHLWDFGGQDLYHGTHALFLQSRSVFLLVWTPASEPEAVETHDHHGMTFRNYPLPYWLEYVRHLAGTDCPVVIVQNQCDRAEDEERRLPVTDELLKGFGFLKIVHYSAMNNRGRAALDEALRQAAAWMRESSGQTLIGKQRLVVKRKLEKLRDDDANRPPSKRKNRTLTQSRFRRICEDADFAGDPAFLLDYLHRAGVVFHREGVFNGEIIIDQAWPLEAVYAVFDRERSYKELRRIGGVFTRSLLEALVWREYSAREQLLFLSLMTSCGVCFVHRLSIDELNRETEYIAPDLLPARGEVEPLIDRDWGNPSASGVRTLIAKLPFLHPGVMRTVISRIGNQAGCTAVYWKDGLCLYERTTRSRALIEQTKDDRKDSWSGQIRVQAYGDRPEELLERLGKLLEDAIRSSGCRDFEIKPPIEHKTSARESRGMAEPPIPLEFVPAPTSKITYGVSYAWNEESKAKVEDLILAAEQRDIIVARDIEGVGIGGSISRFMDRLTDSDRMFVILSDKYLKSPFCMGELLHVWTKCKQEGESFRRRVRVFLMEDAKIMTIGERYARAVHWRNEFKHLDEQGKEHGFDLLGEMDLKRYKLMQQFALHVGDMLCLIADTLLPRKFDEFLQYGFDEPPDQ